jgi:chemosensory pili system protein ChpA (sensor histidine kinase/response regulator)
MLRNPEDILPSATQTMPPQREPTPEELDEIPPEMKRLFIVEAGEDLHVLRTLVLRYEQEEDDQNVLPGMAHIAHKIKGSAATLDYEILARLMYIYEDIIKVLQSRQVPHSPDAVAILAHGLELLVTALEDASVERASDPHLVTEASALLEKLKSSSALAPEAIVRATVPLPETARTDAPTATPVPAGEGESLLHIDIRRLDDLMRHISSLAINRASMTQIRKDVWRLDAELSQSLARLSELGAQLADASLSTGEHRHQPVGKADWRHVHPAMSPSVSMPRDSGPRWDSLELEHYTDFDHTSRAFAEAVADIETTTRTLRNTMQRLAQVSETQATLAVDLQRDVLDLRLVPLSDLIPRLQLDVRRTATSVTKAVSFSFTGEHTQIDRNISEALAEPLIQILRNAVIHGIEPVEERVEAGKPATGSLWMHAAYLGGEVVIEIGDDGRGINPDQLAATAVAMEMISKETAERLTQADALDLIFTLGMTTADRAMLVGGRGVGLDQVRTDIRRLKGSVTVQSELNRRTVFRVRVPISLSLVRALRVSAAGQQFGVPFASVHSSAQLSPAEILVSASTSDDRGSQHRLRRRIRVRRDTMPSQIEGYTVDSYDEIPVYTLGELLGFEHTPHPATPALIVEIGARRAAVLVDEVLEELDLVNQALPRHLQRTCVRGATVMPDGTPALLLDLVELLAPLVEGYREPPDARPAVPVVAMDRPKVLVVDDSVSMRRALEATLSRAGFEVALARDGIEALDLMLNTAPQAVLLDIEMPRLDGFELLTIMRNTPRIAGIHVAMLTSRAAEKHQKYATNLGAEAYLIKPCPPETIIETVNMLVARTTKDTVLWDQ